MIKKYCTVCGAPIAEERGGEIWDVPALDKPMSYFRFIRLKYCDKCRKPAQTQQVKDWKMDYKEIKRDINKAARKRLELLEARNRYLEEMLVQEGVL